MSEAETETETIEIGAVLYERPSEGVVRLVLNRPEKANAQNLQKKTGNRRSTRIRLRPLLSNRDPRSDCRKSKTTMARKWRGPVSLT